MAENTETTGQDALLAELNAKVGVLETAVADKDAQIEELKAQVKDLQANASVTTKAAGDAPIVTYQKASYQVVHGVFFEGTKYTREDIAKDKKLMAKIFEKGSSAVVKL